MIVERDIKPEDYKALTEAIAADPAHKDWMKPEFFNEPQTKSLVFEDDNGPILFLRMSSALRIHIQFANCEDKDRIRKALIFAGASIVPNARRNGYKQIIYETFSKPLKWFCHRYLGFVSSSDEQVLWLESNRQTAIESSTCEPSSPIANIAEK